MTALRYPIVLFDWGNTVMKDDPLSLVPMVEWPTVEAIDGIAAVLDYIHSSGRRIMLATSASISDEGQIRAALARVGLDRYFSHIYCFKNTGLTKGKAFYHRIMSYLHVDVSDVLMIGDSFEKDVLAANNAGIFAIWFNPHSDEVRKAELHATVHSMEQLTSFFRVLDSV